MFENQEIHPLPSLVTAQQTTFVHVVCFIYADAPSIFFPSKTKTILSWKGRPVKLKCSAVGDPVAQFSWTRADKRMLDGEFETFGNSSILSIVPSADSDFTDYTCTARNIIGEDNRTFILKPIRKYVFSLYCTVTQIVRFVLSDWLQIYFIGVQKIESTRQL